MNGKLKIQSDGSEMDDHTSAHADVKACGAVTISRNGYVEELEEENRHLKDMLASLSKTHATDMQRLSDMIDRRNTAGREIIEAARRSLPRPHPTIERNAKIFIPGENDKGLATQPAPQMPEKHK